MGVPIVRHVLASGRRRAVPHVYLLACLAANSLQALPAATRPLIMGVSVSSKTDSVQKAFTGLPVAASVSKSKGRTISVAGSSFIVSTSRLLPKRLGRLRKKHVPDSTRSTMRPLLST